jgi:hypothetical protein
VNGSTVKKLSARFNVFFDLSVAERQQYVFGRFSPLKGWPLEFRAFGSTTTARPPEAKPHQPLYQMQWQGLEEGSVLT